MAAMVLTVACSCSKPSSDVEQEDGKEIWVSVDWSDCTQEKPSGMSLYFYRKDKSDSPPVIKLTNSVSGAMVYLPYGLYDILLISQSIDEYGHIRFTGMDRFDTATAVLEGLETSWDVQSDGQMVASEPDLLAVDSYENFDSENTESIKLKPHSIIYSVKASLGVEGLDRITDIRASITGMAGACNLSSGLQSGDAVTHVPDKWFKATSEGNKSIGTVFTTFRSFGIPAGKSELSAEDIVIHSTHLIGNEYKASFSTPVGDTMVKNDSTRTISFIADKLGGSVPIVIPVVGSAKDEGFKVTVVPWGQSQTTDVIVQ